MRKAIVERERCCLITITLCLPVAFRIDEGFWIIFQQLCRGFYEILDSGGYKANFDSSIRGHDGPAAFITTKTDAEIIKRLCIEAEETIPFGRILDIDVMDYEGKPISRNDLGLAPRKCFICDNPAALCVSRKLHSSEEIYTYVERIKEQITASK
jgi:holo-ACP synthase CitX